MSTAGPGTPQVEEVSDAIYAYIQPDGTWYINNAGFIVGRAGVISVDTTSTEARTHAYIDSIASVTKAPVRTVINTHHHGDHTYGNYLFTGATIIAHEQTRQHVTAAGPPANRGLLDDVEWGDVVLTPPFLTYEDGVTLWVDDLKVEVRHVGQAAHTTNDSIVWIPDRSVLFAGDLLFNGGMPYLMEGSIAGLIDVLKHVVRPLGAETIIAGHGPVAGPELIDITLAYLTFVQDTARRMREAGLTPMEAALEIDLGEYASLTDPERIVANLYRAYSELDGAENGALLDTVAIRKEMVAFNGGRPLTCHA